MGDSNGVLSRPRTLHFLVALQLIGDAKTLLTEATATHSPSVTDQQTRRTMTAVHRPRVFLDINTGGQPAGRLTIELFVDKTPRTCEK